MDREAIDAQDILEIAASNVLLPAYQRWSPRETGYNIKDVRSCIFEGLFKCISNYHTSLIPLSGLPITPLMNVSSEEVAHVFTNEYRSYYKWAYLNNVWMLMEEFFRDIAGHLGIKERDIKKVVGKCFNACTVRKRGKRLVEILRLIRNTMHYNGIHTSHWEDGRRMWKGKIVSFRSGKPVSGWVLHEDFLVVDMQKSLVDLIEDFFSCKELRNEKFIERIYCPKPLSLLCSHKNAAGHSIQPTPF